MEEIINSKKAKPARGFVTVQLFDEFGRILQEEKTENNMTHLVTNRMKWRLRQDFYSGHPSSTLTEPVYPLNCIILDLSTDATIYDTYPLYRNIGQVIGWSDKTNYSGTDTFRGTINAAESYTNNERVHYVFDWPTHAANGTFQTIAWGNISNNTYSGTFINSFASPDSDVQGLAWDGTNLWFAGDYNDKIYKLNPNTGEVISSFATPDNSPRGLVWDGTYLWLAGSDYYNPKIYKLNPNTGAVISSFTSPDIYPQGLAWDGTNLWVVGDYNDKIYKLNPNTGAVINWFTAPDVDPRGITFEGANLWFAGNNNKKIYKLNPNTGEVISSFATPDNSPRGLVWDGTYLWLSGNSNKKIYKGIDATIGTITKLPNPVTKTSTNTMKVQYDFIFVD